MENRSVRTFDQYTMIPTNRNKIDAWSDQGRMVIVLYWIDTII